MYYHIGDYEVHTDTHELLLNGCPQKIEPLVFRLLEFMLENPDRVLSRDELTSEVWKSRVISDSALSATICAVRHAIGDSGNKQECIKTVPGYGYRFIAPLTCLKSNKVFTKSQSTSLLTRSQCNIEQVNVSDLVTTPNDEKLQETLVLPDKPSVAVMDFVDTGSGKEGALLAYGITSEVNSGLARLPHFFVIARASAASFSKQNLVPREISRRLGVRYLVYGNTERLSNRIRITFSVVDAMHDTEIWSEHFYRSVDDLPQIQDEVTRSIVVVIDSAIEQVEIDRAFLIPTENLSAWENYHRGFWHLNRTTIEDINAAQHFFQKAISLDSRFSRANAGLSFTYSSRRLLNDFSADSEDDLKKALDYAQHSIDYCNREAMGYMSFGRAYYFAREYYQALQILDNGIRANPNYVYCHSIKAMVAAASAPLSSLALQHLDIADRLSPFDPLQFSHKTARAIALVAQKKYDDAMDMSLQATNCSNAYFSTYAIATACLQLANHTKQAKHYAAKVLKLKPDYSVELYQRITPYADKSIRNTFIKAMEGAGIPKVTNKVSANNG